MTLVAGFVCPDGFVIAGDTESTVGHALRVQENKIIGSTGSSFRLVLGGAGRSSYLDELMQEVRERVDALPVATIATVDLVLRDAVRRMHEDNIFKHWAPSDPDRPCVALIVGLVVGLRGADGEREIWKTDDKTVSGVDGCAFVGSGALLAAHVAEKLFKKGQSTAIVHHLATQILREVKTKGAYVGGNTDTWSVRTTDDTPFFSIELDDDLHLWGVEDALMSATRCALSGRADAMNKRLQFIGRRLEQLRAAASKPMPGSDREWHTIEVCRPDTNPFRDFDL